jgi:ribosomal-protein-alanine N-acetyltransferase
VFYCKCRWSDGNHTPCSNPVSRRAGLIHLGDYSKVFKDRQSMKTLSVDGNVHSDKKIETMLTSWGQRQALNDCGLWSFYTKTDQSFVGYCGLLPTKTLGTDDTELLYGLSSDHWRQGYCTEMAQLVLAVGFETFKLPEIIDYTMPHNKGSRGVMEKCGITYERDFVHATLPHVLYRLPNPIL